MSSTTTHTDVKDINNGGNGVPVPIYFCTFRGESIQVLPKGDAHVAVEWLEGKDARFAVIAQIDGSVREVARGEATLR